MERLGLAYHPLFTAHDTGPDHPERPERIRAVMKAINDAPWSDHVDIVEAREATIDEVALVHDRQYIEDIRSICLAGGEYLPAMEASVNPQSYPAALRAVGAGLTLADAVIAGRWKIGFAPTRPPGHHAPPNRPMGFCLFNNIAVLARYLVDIHGIKKVAILDFDVHHGNGTETAFWTDPDVLYCSLHRDNLFPYDKGRVLDRGAEKGAGYTLNIPLVSGGGDEDYLNAMDKTVEPHIREFAPEIVLVSAGFDAHWRDPLGGMKLTRDGYSAIADRLVRIASDTAKGRIISLLEGGYDLQGLAEGTVIYLQRLIRA